MAINIEWQKLPTQNNDATNNTPLYPRIADNQTIDFLALCDKVAKHGVCSKGIVQSVISDMADVIAELLYEGKTIELETLGTFRLAIGTTGNVTQSTPLRARNVVVRGVNFQPSKVFMESIGNPEFRFIPYNTSPATISDEKLQHILLEYFKTNNNITRSQFERLCNLRRTTAYTRLKKLVESGFLVKVGTNKNTRYALRKTKDDTAFT